MNIKMRAANSRDYEAVTQIMSQVQNMHVKWRPDIYRHKMFDFVKQMKQEKNMDGIVGLICGGHIY